MGFRYRKSINLGGGFRVNISKSGIGYSWGVKGYRVTRTSKGTTRKTISIPGTGISFVNESRRKENSLSSQKTQSYNPISANNHYDTEEIVNSVATNMVSEGTENILSIARRALAINKASSIGIGVCLLLSFVNPIFILFLVAFIILKLYVKSAGKIDLEYMIDKDQKQIISKRLDPMLKITESKKIWRIMQSSKVIDKKYSAGASNTVKRISCQATKTSPFPFKSNIPVASFKSRKETLAFFPDKLFIIQGSKIGALNYSDISISTHTTRFIESEHVPKDASVVDSTWRYVNKSGGPDKRFKNNRQLPVCLYGEMELKSVSGLNTLIMFSNANLK